MTPGFKNCSVQIQSKNPYQLRTLLVAVSLKQNPGRVSLALSLWKAISGKYRNFGSSSIHTSPGN